MLVDKPRWDEGMATLHEIMYKSTKELLRTKSSRPREIRKARETASDNIKVLSNSLLRFLIIQLHNAKGSTRNVLQ